METKLAIPTLVAGGKRNLNRFVDVTVRSITSGDDGYMFGVIDYQGATYRVRRNTRLNTAWFIYERAA